MAETQTTLLNLIIMAKLKDSFKNNQKPPFLSGRYDRQGSTLKGSEKPITLIIGTRKKASPKKPKYYLLQKHSPQKFTYVSSLFPINEYTFSADYQGCNYQVSFSDDSAIIEPIKSGQ